MHSPGVIGLIGTIAALSTTSSFIPQILKIRKQGGADLSYFMLTLYLFGVLLWLVYGFTIHAQAVIWANLAATVLVATALALKTTWRGTAGNAGRPARRLRIAVDMDEVIADALSRHLALYHRATGEILTPDIIREQGLEAAIPARIRAVFESLPHQEGFFDDLLVIPNSQRALEILSSEFDVFITSAAMEVPGSFAAKFGWLRQHFPFIPTRNLVFCGDKGIIDADYLIDDRSRHFTAFRGTGILFTAPHNAREHAPLRANNWDEVLALLMKKPSPPHHQPSAKTEITEPRELAISN